VFCEALIMRARLIAASLLALALMSTSCGGNDGKKAAIGGSTTSAPAVNANPPTTAQASAADRARVEGAVVQRSDLPESGWREQPNDEKPNHEATWLELTGCLGLGDPNAGEHASATSATYVTSFAEQVTSTVQILDTDRIRRITDGLRSSSFSACAQKAFAADIKRNGPEGATPGTVQVVPLDVAKLGEFSSAYRASTTLSVGPGIMIPVFTDFVTVANGRVLSRVTFINAGPGATPFPAELEQSLVQTVVSRAGT
jgi:hypothetical protein